jgi:YggT family protein
MRCILYIFLIGCLASSDAFTVGSIGARGGCLGRRAFSGAGTIMMTQMSQKPSEFGISSTSNTKRPLQHKDIVQTVSEAPLQSRLPTQLFALVAPVFLAASVASAGETGGDSMLAVAIARPILDNFVNIMSFLFICRTVLSWYPKTDLKAFPYNVIAWPTEALAQPVRELIPPAFGVDISSIVWIMILSFVREVLTGQQGVLTLIERGG